MNFKEDDVVLCTVNKIEGTTIFLAIEGGGEGSMVFSEVSPGRIRNIREFIVPHKKVVCKILRLKGNQVELSLRRVTAKEREEVMDHYTKEKTLRAILKPVVKENLALVLQKINTEYDLAEFLDKARENSKLIEKFVSKEESELLVKIFSEKKEKEKEIKTKVVIRTKEPSGILDIQNILTTKDAEVRYLGSSTFSIAVKEKEFKLANTKMENILKEMKDRAKKLKVELEIK